MEEGRREAEAEEDLSRKGKGKEGLESQREGEGLRRRAIEGPKRESLEREA